MPSVSKKTRPLEIVVHDILFKPVSCFKVRLDVVLFQPNVGNFTALQVTVGTYLE